MTVHGKNDMTCVPSKNIISLDIYLVSIVSKGHSPGSLRYTSSQNFKQKAKILIRLGVSPGFSEFSLFKNVILLVLYGMAKLIFS